MTCPECRAETSPDARFCAACGSALALRACAACGATLPEDARFCPGCGRAVIAAVAPARFSSPDTYTPRRLAERILHDRRALEGERKQVTVLFADLRGSMELIAERDTEQARKILDRVLELMMESVHRYEGTVNQVMGDGIMAIFGAPLAHEDHAVRACYAALRMQERVQRWADEARRELGCAVAIRVGLNSGDVLVRAIANDLHMDYTAVGVATHLAARLEQMAAPGTILLSSQTARLASGFIETRTLGPSAVRGLSEPVEVYELLAATPVRTRLQRAATQGLTRFVGREHELQALARAADQARRGDGRSVVIIGEAGVGKSRLMWELARELGTAGWLVLEGHCLSYDRSAAYAPVIELLRGYFDVRPSEAVSVARDKIATRLFALDPGLAGHLPALQALLGLAVDDERWRRLDPLERRRETMDAVRRLLVRESQTRPVLVAIDDLHWVDADSQTLFHTIAETVRMLPMLLLVGYRPGYEAPWTALPHAEKLRLEPLSDAAADLLLDSLLGTGPDLAELRQLLLERTAGNPFFIEESVAMLATNGVLVGDRERYALARATTTISIPLTVRAVLAWRIDQLAAEDKRLLEAAAVVGKEVPVAILQAVTELGEEPLHAGLARLRSAELLYETRLFPEMEYAFKHPITHEVAYEGLAHERRRAMHARVVSALSEGVDAARLDERVAALGLHALHAGLWAQAVTWLRRAGAKAAQRSASAEAVGRFEQALGALAHLPATPRNLELAMDIRFELRNPLFLLADFPRTLTTLEEVSAMAEAAGDQDRLGRSSAFLANAHFMLGNVEQGIALAEQALRIGEQRGDATVLAFAWCDLGQLRYVSGDLEGALAALAACRKCLQADSIRSRRNIVQLYGVVAECFVALAQTDRGAFADAETAAERCSAIAEESPAPFYRALASWAAGSVRLARGGVEAGLAALRRACAECDEADIRSIRPWIAGEFGLALLSVGRADDAVAVLDRAVSDAAALRLGAGQSLRLERLAQALAAAGRPTEARETAERAVAAAHQHEEHGFRASSLRALGAVEVQLGDLTGGGEHLEQALALATRCGMRPLVARCHVDLWARHRRAGDEPRARQALAQVYAVVRELGLGAPQWLPAGPPLEVDSHTPS
jgi:class 3 adenylate cyclase/tetratricopeptide (TPR) repeat protein